MTRITRQIGEAVRESLKGKPRETVNAAVRRAVKDVVFLIKLQHQVNYKVMIDSRTWRLTQALMAEALNNLYHEFFYQALLADTAERVNFETPYPLDSETARAVDLAVR